MKARIMFFAAVAAVCAVEATDLPSNYRSIGWVEATGTQWVKTDFVPASTDRVEARVCMTRMDVTQSIFFSRDENAQNALSCLFIAGDGGGKLRFDRHAGQVNGTGPAANVDASIVYDGLQCYGYLDDEIVTTLPRSAYTPVAPLVLFATQPDGAAVSEQSTTAFRAFMRLYSLVVKGADGTVKLDLCPCQRVSDDVVGLYDRIGSRFYTGLGGDLVAGAASVFWRRKPSIQPQTWNRRDGWTGEIDLGDPVVGTVTCDHTAAQLAALTVGRHTVTFQCRDGSDTVLATWPVDVDVRDPLACTMRGDGRTVDLTFAAASDDRVLYVAVGAVDGGFETNGWRRVESLTTVPGGVDHLDGVVLPDGVLAAPAARVFLESDASGVYSASDYVQDGLTVQYDAIENAGANVHDENARTWKDLKGGHDLTLVSSDEVSANSILIGSTVHSAGTIFSEHTDATFECNVLPVEDRSQSGAAFMIVPYVGSLIWVAGPTVLNTRRPQGEQVDAKFLYQSYTTGFSTFEDFVASGEYRTISAVFSFGSTTESTIPLYVDGVRQGLSGHVNYLNYTRNSDLSLTIGHADNKTRFRSIRVYNRPLTAEEVQLNHRVDLARFEGVGTWLEASALIRPVAPQIVHVRKENGVPVSAEVEFGASTEVRTLFVAWAVKDLGEIFQNWTNTVAVQEVPSGVQAVTVNLPQVVRDAFAAANGRGVFRIFLASGANLTAQDYVTSGLVMQYDGIENAGFGQHTRAPSVWVDLVGGRNLTLVSGDVVGHDHVLIGSSEHKPATPFASFKNATFECSVLPVEQREPAGNPFVIVPYIGSMIWVPGATVFNTRRSQGSESNAQYLYQSYTTGFASFEEYVASGEFHTISVSGFWFGATTNSVMPVYVDGARQGLSGHVNFLNYTHATDLSLTIGHGNNRTRFRSLRLYDRPLTAAEVVQNRQVDAVRFDRVYEVSDCALKYRGVVLYIR